MPRDLKELKAELLERAAERARIAATNPPPFKFIDSSKIVDYGPFLQEYTPQLKAALREALKWLEYSQVCPDFGTSIEDEARIDCVNDAIDTAFYDALANAPLPLDHSLGGLMTDAQKCLTKLYIPRYPNGNWRGYKKMDIAKTIAGLHAVLDEFEDG